MGITAFAEPEAFAVHFEDMGVMGQAAQNSTGEAFRAEDFGLFINWLCLECGRNFLATISEHYDLDLIRRRGQG